VSKDRHHDDRRQDPLRELLEMGSNATFLREMIGFAAERLVAPETETLCGAAPGERSTGRTKQRNGIVTSTWDGGPGALRCSRARIRSRVGRTSPDARQQMPGPDHAICVGCQEMPTWMEEAMDGCMSGEEDLGLRLTKRLAALASRRS
jgi:hypothetical protein